MHLNGLRTFHRCLGLHNSQAKPVVHLLTDNLLLAPPEDAILLTWMIRRHYPFAILPAQVPGLRLNTPHK